MTVSNQGKCSLHWGLRQGWAGGLWGLRFCWFVEVPTGGNRQPQRTEPCQCLSGQPWANNGALPGQMEPLQYSAGVVEPALGAAAGLGRWFVGVAVLPVCGDFQKRRQHMVTTANRPLPVCERPALGMPRGTAMSNAASAVCSRCGGTCTTGGCGRAGQVVCGGCSFAGLWRFPEEEAALSNHNAQSPASV